MQYNKELWSEIQGPMHLNPQSVQNLETFASAGGGPGDFSMADISQQTFAMSCQLRDVRVAPGAERLPSPRRVAGALLRPEEADMQRPHQVDICSQPTFGISEDWTVVPESATPNPLAGCVEASELERLIRQQVGAGPNMAQAAQVLQNIQSQLGPFQADFLQQTMQEIAKRCAAPESLAGEWGASAVAAMANGGLPAPAVPGMGMSEQFGPWSNWGQQPLGATLPPGSGLVSSSLPPKGDDKTLGHAENGRIEELNQYIRQQSQEYMEGQAEWSRQIAEVKSECLRELEKVRRDKDEVERQARQEILRLSQRLREFGIKDEGAPAGDSPDSQAIGSWAKGVSFEEYQDVHRKWTAAEERIQQLEDYIKDQSSKQIFPGDCNSKDEEIQRLKQVVLTSSMELQQVIAESQASRTHYEQKMQCLEQGIRRVLSNGEQILGQRTERMAEEERCHEDGHFGRTATKLSLTLSQGKEGGNVGSLRRLLKDALAQSAPDSKNAKAQKEKKPRKVKDEETRLVSAEEPALDEGKLDERGRAEDGTKSGEGECSTPWSPSISVAGGLAALSESNASSRETSPGRGVQMSRHCLTPLSYNNGLPVDTPLNTSAAMAFVSQVVSEMRQLLASREHLGAIGTSPAASLGTSPQASPRSASTSSGSHEAKVDRGKVQDILDCVAPARKEIATSIITVEKMLRCLERDLRNYCLDLLGKAELEVRLLSGSEEDGKGTENEEASYASAAEEEAKMVVPLSTDLQVESLSALRRAQQRSSSLLAQFVKLPQKLKVVFDLTKKLGIEVTNFVPQAALHQAEARAYKAHTGEQRQSFHVELLQKRVHDLTSKVAKLEGGVNGTDQEGSASELDAEVVAKQIHEEIQRGVSKDDQLLVACTKVRQLNRDLASQATRVKTLEEEVVDLHLSRYNERAQCMALMAQSAGLPNPPAMAPWMFPPLGMPDFADQACSPGKQCPIPKLAAWPPATCVK